MLCCLVALGCIGRLCGMVCQGMVWYVRVGAAVLCVRCCCCGCDTLRCLLLALRLLLLPYLRCRIELASIAQLSHQVSISVEG